MNRELLNIFILDQNIFPDEIQNPTLKEILSFLQVRSENQTVDIDLNLSNWNDSYGDNSGWSDSYSDRC